MFKGLLLNRVTGAFAIALLGVPGMLAFAEGRIPREIALFSPTEEATPTIQERARKKLIRVRAAAEQRKLVDQTLGIDPPETLIADSEAEADIDDIDAFPVVLAAPTN